MDFWTNLLDRLPPWFFTWAALAVLIGVALAVWWLGTGAHKFWKIMNAQQQTLDLTRSLAIEEERSRILNSRAEQVATSLVNVAHLVGAAAGLSSLTGTELRRAAEVLVQRAVDVTAADVKHRPGDHHRCGMWVEEDGELTLLWGSAGFSTDYVLRRKLRVDKSLAGVAFRRKKTVVWDNVRKEDDWEENPDSTSSYSSLICIPVVLDIGSDPVGIITIDGLNPMTNEARLIGEAYGKVVELTLGEFQRSFNPDDPIDEERGTEKDSRSSA